LGTAGRLAVSKLLLMLFPLDSLNPAHFWLQIPLLTKLFLLFFAAVSLYILISLVRVFLRLRSLKSLATKETSVDAVRPSLVALQHRLNNLRCLLLFVFFLFAFCFFLQIPAAFVIFGDSKLPGFTIILMQLATYFEYATDVCLLFLFLHSVHWLTSTRVETLVRKLQLS
jgi:hypothetical protein